MSYLKLEHRVLGDPRLLGMSPTAFTVHVFALDYANEHATDGRIPARVAHRLMCPVEPAEIAVAFTELVSVGLWTEDGDDYLCPEFLAYGLPADEQRTTRNKWAQDKRRRRLHGVGNHALCLPASCPAKREEEGQSGTESTRGVELSPPRGGRPDPTRPDPTPKGSGKGSGPDGHPARADARPSAAGPEEWVESISRETYDETHEDIYIRFHSDDIRPPNVHHILANELADLLIDLERRHRCRSCDAGVDGDEHPTTVWITVPNTVTDAWQDRALVILSRIHDAWWNGQLSATSTRLPNETKEAS